jgi:hypothetical protein
MKKITVTLDMVADESGPIAVFDLQHRQVNVSISLRDMQKIFGRNIISDTVKVSFTTEVAG